MKTFISTLSSFILLAALAFSTNLLANNIVDREPTSVEFLEGKVYRLSVQLEEVRFALKDRSLTKLEKKKLKLQRRHLRRELNYNRELLSHARFPARFAHPGPWRIYNYNPVFIPRRRVYCPPSYRRPVVIVNQNRSRRNDDVRRPQPRRSQVSPRTVTPRRQSPGTLSPGRNSSSSTNYISPRNRAIKIKR